MKILVTRKLHDFAIKELEGKYDVEVYTGKVPMPKKTLISRIKDKDGIICYPYDVIDKEIIDVGKKLKVISTYSVGYDHIDVKSALDRGIIVTYTPEVLTRATADLTLALILTLFRRITEGDRLIRRDEWKTILGPNEFLGKDLYQKTLGIFGMGRIGKAVAKRASAFEMNIIYHNRTRLSKLEEKKIGVSYTSLNNLFQKSDVVSIHVPYTPQTHEVVNLKLLSKMKKTAFLVNTARGKIINENDLITALKRNTIAGAALDVFQNEPIHSTHPFAGMPNTVIMPHSGSATIETRKNMAEIAVKNLILALDGKKPIYRVNM